MVIDEKYLKRLCARACHARWRSDISARVKCQARSYTRPRVLANKADKSAVGACTIRGLLRYSAPRRRKRRAYGASCVYPISSMPNATLRSLTVFARIVPRARIPWHAYTLSQGAAVYSPSDSFEAAISHGAFTPLFPLRTSVPRASRGNAKEITTITI